VGSIKKANYDTTLMTFGNNKVATMSSLELLDAINQARAEFGESEVRRNDFLSRCKDELSGEHYESFVVTNGNGTESEVVHMTLDQCMYVAMRESKGVRRQVQAKLREAQQPAIDLENPEHLRGLLVTYAEKAIELKSQLAHAIATKAQISDRKTATAMATASAKSRETTKLRALMGEAAQSASIFAVENKTKGKFAWRPLRDYCNASELHMGNSWNPGMQINVKTYPAAAWLAVFGVDLASLFGEVAA
jgi:hypothetical protein